MDMAMATPSTSTAAVAVSDSEVPCLGSIEDLKLKVGPVRRNLFGPVDHHQLQQDFQRLLCMSVEVANKRWNFDFQSDRPGQGSTMEWEELKYQDVPRFYRSCTVRRMAGSGGWPKTPRRPSSGESSPASSSSSSSGDEYIEVTARGCYILQRPNKRKQAIITDFFKVKRRRLLNYKGSTRL
ncbi:cyclin-dependent kinase inhibitor 1D [Lampris incognitus]|uniref:cyclin-dependent kinase inhibitor 1D n=1 Tax=Lampris incognitus TaxID=2546036 RepID=UPI0024B55B2D|nr:cyclin-dependent kinase inhibitor 1D [Lampris incognitus]